MALQAHKNESQWYIDSGCSKHMTRDQNNFISLKNEKGSNVTFGDNVSTKIIGKGIESLGNKKVRAKNVLLVEDLKHNFLNVSHMCDQGHTCTFNS